MLLKGRRERRAQLVESHRGNHEGEEVGEWGGVEAGGRIAKTKDVCKNCAETYYFINFHIYIYTQRDRHTFIHKYI